MTDRAIEKIREQVGLTPAHMVYVIEVLSIRFERFSDDLTRLLESFQNLQMLTLNDCGIKSLNGFPLLPGLIRLDLVFNQIPGEDLGHLSGSRHLQTLMLGANKVEKIDDLSALKGMKQLFQLDLINNPVQKEAGYRVKVFSLLSSLTVLDTLDKSGKDAFNTTSMVQTVSRVPQTLFDTSKPSPSPFGSGSIFGSTVPTGGLFGSTAPTGSLFGIGKSSSKPGGIFGTSAPTGSLFASSAPAVAPTVTKKRSKKGVTTLPTRPAVPSVPAPPSTRVSKASKGAKGGKAVAPKAAHGRSARAGIVFPVTRIKRHLRDASVDMRVSVGSSVFLAAVLEYLTAELVELAGNACKADKKARITPRMIKFAIDNDEELKKMLVDITIPRQQ